MMLSCLALTEMITLGTDIRVIGGSGEQAQRVNEYIRNENPAVSGKFWQAPMAPTELLGATTKTSVSTTNGGHVKALMASSTSIRGAHPVRLRMDECLARGTLVTTEHGQVPIEDVSAGTRVLGIRGSNLAWDTVELAANKGIRETLTLRFSDGRTLTCTPDHKLLTEAGWAYAREIKDALDRWTDSDRSLLRVREATVSEHEESPVCSDRTLPGVLQQEEGPRSQSLRRLREEEKGRSAQGRGQAAAVHGVLPENRSRSGQALRGLREDDFSSVYDMSPLLPGAQAGEDGPLRRLPHSSTAVELDQMSVVLAEGAIRQGDDGAHGCGAGDSTQDEGEDLKARACCSRASRPLRTGVGRPDSGQELDSRPLRACEEPDGGSPRGLLARQAKCHRARCSEKGCAGGDGISGSGTEASTDAHVVASTPAFLEVTSVRLGPSVEVWDLACPNTHSFVANGLVVHNCDEMELNLFDAAQGQTMQRGGVDAQTTLSSTHHYPDGVMTEVKRRARQQGFPLYSWCYKESMEPHGWLPESEVARKRREVPEAMFRNEYDLQEPSPEGRVFTDEVLENLFDKQLGVFEGEPGKEIVVIPYASDKQFFTGADFARREDFSVFHTMMRSSTGPDMLAAWQRVHRLPWPVIISKFNTRLHEYQGASIHDETGIGDLVGDYLTADSEGFNFSRMKESWEMYSSYVAACEAGEIAYPMIRPLYEAHRFVTVDDLFGPGHVPDEIVAAALAWRARTWATFNLQLARL